MYSDENFTENNYGFKNLLLYNKCKPVQLRKLNKSHHQENGTHR
jgi:hypothetical protein